MAKESISMVEISAIGESKTATGVDEKKYVNLNGFDTALRKDAKLLVLSTSMKKETRKSRNGNPFDYHFFWAIDLIRNKLVQPSRTGLSGGMGYEQLPLPGVWSLNEEGTWHVLKPQEDDPAIKTRRNWGISRILPGAFDKEKNGKVIVPKCFVIEVTDVKYLCGRSPIDASASSTVKAKELSDCEFKEGIVRMWDGNAYYPSRELVAEAVAAYNKVHEQQFTDALIEELLK